MPLVDEGGLLGAYGPQREGGADLGPPCAEREGYALRITVFSA